MIKKTSKLNIDTLIKSSIWKKKRFFFYFCVILLLYNLCFSFNLSLKKTSKCPNKCPWCNAVIRPRGGSRELPRGSHWSLFCLCRKWREMLWTLDKLMPNWDWESSLPASKSWNSSPRGTSTQEHIHWVKVIIIYK